MPQTTKSGRGPSSAPASNVNTTIDNPENSTGSSPFADLTSLIGLADTDMIEVCWLPVDGTFQFEHATTQLAPDVAARVAEDADVWFSINPVAPPARGRGKADDVTRCAVLAIDLDVKSGGVPDAATAQAVVTDLTRVLDEYPVAVVSSGHGWHVYWALDADDAAWTLDSEPKRVAAQSVYRRFHRLAAHIAERHGAGVDNISDLSRILRVPGTFNRKDPSDPIAVELFTAHPYGGGAPMSIEQVTEVLTAYGVPETDEDRAVAGVVVSETSAWEFGRQTTAYVEAMVAGWSADRPDVGRHGWLVSQAVRLACARRLGRITESDYRQATEALEARFKELLRTHGDRRDPTPGEVPGALAWGVWRASTLTDEQAADEVGGADEHTDTSHVGGVYLPAEFFESRVSLRHIRDAALSYPAAPDATLMAALARISAAIPPSVRVNTGSMAPLPLHLYADLVSRTGAGKSTAIEAAMKAIEVCPEWADDALGLTPDGVLIPVGEPFPHVAKPRTSAGIAEQFWGMIPDLMDPKKKVRARVRSNVLLLTDEGSGLIKHIRDDKETVGETLREAWSGTLIGQSNADYMKYRPVEPGTYTIALVTGMQLSVLGQLLSREELEKGTPQRFIYSWCKPNPAEVTAESIAAVVAPDHPLEVKIPTRGLRLCETLRTRVRADRIASMLADDSDQNMRLIESQKPASVARLAALLAILDGRTETDDEGLLVVNEEDWALAETVFATSVAIADLAVAERRSKAATDKQVQRERNLAESIEDDEARSTPEGRAAARIIGYLRDAGPGTHRWSGKGGLRTKFNSDQIKTADAALDQLDGTKVKVTRKGQSVSVELTA